MEGGDERRLIDNTMTKLRALVEELNIGMILVSHLKRPSGDKGHEDGAQTSLAQLRGSAAIAQLSDMVMGIERNQQDKARAHISTVRVLKNRWTGETGEATHLEYNKDTGRMVEVAMPDEEFETDEDF
jgi:twinkle protein